VLCKQQLRAIAIIEPKASDVVLQGATCHRGTQNPLKYASAEALIFEELQAVYRLGYKVMFCARAFTGYFPLNAPGTSNTPPKH
jgi:hypothetical protein